MIDTEERIIAFIALGKELEKAVKDPDSKLGQLAETLKHHNGWFSPDNVKYAFAQWSKLLVKEKLEDWIYSYKSSDKEPKTIAVIMAGNIPMVGFHDLLCVLASGNRALVKLSSKDNVLMREIIKTLLEIEPKFYDFIRMEDGILKDFDAVVATGSDNSSRYFDFYFGKYPHIIRKNRTSAAVLTGKESDDDLRNLGWDIFRYFGLGCRSVTKLFTPQGYDFSHFFEALNPFHFVRDHNKYANNYDYNKAIFLMNKTIHLDNGFLMLEENKGFFTPAALLYYEEYQTIEDVNAVLKENASQLQCVVSIDHRIENAIAPGTSQTPGLAEYADGVDTMEFLLEL